ncbi:MAG: alpha-L-fucosidase, partial [Brevundimonas sp.]
MPGAAGSGPFKPTWDSLIAGYSAPDWFRDAKLGLWAHWGPQCVPEFGDWYGRQMYIQGNPYYDHHLANYGHPSETG